METTDEGKLLYEYRENRLSKSYKKFDKYLLAGLIWGILCIIINIVFDLYHYGFSEILFVNLIIYIALAIIGYYILYIPGWIFGAILEYMFEAGGNQSKDRFRTESLNRDAVDQIISKARLFLFVYIFTSFYLVLLLNNLNIIDFFYWNPVLKGFKYKLSIDFINYFLWQFVLGPILFNAFAMYFVDSKRG